MTNFNILLNRKPPAPGAAEHAQNLEHLGGLTPLAVAQGVEGYLGELSQDPADPAPVRLDSVALLDGYRRAEVAAAGAPTSHREAKRLERLKDTTAKEIALQAIITNDYVPAGPLGTRPTLHEIYNKKDRARYKELVLYRQAIENPTPNGPSRLTVARRALDVYGKIGSHADRASEVTNELFQIAGAGGTYDKATLRLGVEADPMALAALDGIFNAAGKPDLLTELYDARHRYNELQSQRMRRWKGSKRTEADENLGAVGVAGSAADDYNQKLNEVAAAIDAGAGTDPEKRALKTLAFNELAIRDAVDQSGISHKESKMVRIGGKFERMGKLGTVLLLGTTAAAAAGIAIGTAGAGLAAPAAASALGGVRVGRSFAMVTLSSARRVASLNLPGLHIAHTDNGRTAKQVTHESDVRIESEDRAKKLGMMLGAAALGVGSVGLVMHAFEGSAGAIHTEGTLGGHNSSSTPSNFNPQTYIEQPSTSSSSEHLTPAITPSGSGSAHTLPAASPHTAPSATPSGHETPSATPSGTPTAPEATPTAPGAATAPPTSGASGAPYVQHLPNSNTSPNGSNAPKIPDITHAVDNLNAQGDNVVQPGEGFDTLIPHLLSHTPGLENTNFSPGDINSIQSEAARQIAEQHITFPNGAPVAYLMQPGEYGIGSTGKLPDAATKIILQVAEQHAVHTATATADVVAGNTVTEVAHNLDAQGYTNISGGEGWDAATNTITQHAPVLHDFNFTPNQINSIQLDAAKEIAAQHITFPDGAPVSYVIESGQYAGEYGIGDTGKLPEAATKIVLQVAEQHAAAIANSEGVNLSTLGEFIKANNITNISEFINHLPPGATSYNRGEGLTTLLSAYSKLGLNLNTNNSLNTIAAQINKAQPNTLTLQAGRWVFTGRGTLNPASINRMLQSLGFGQQDLALAA